MAIASALFLQHLELEVRLGHSPEERQQKQKIALDITIRFQQPPTACDTDNLPDTNCYDLLVKSLDMVTKSREFHLIEHLAKSLYDHIKPQFTDAIQLSICIKKDSSFYIKNLKGGVSFHYGD